MSALSIVDSMTKEQLELVRAKVRRDLYRADAEWKDTLRSLTVAQIEAVAWVWPDIEPGDLVAAVGRALTREEPLADPEARQ